MVSEGCLKQFIKGDDFLTETNNNKNTNEEKRHWQGKPSKGEYQYLFAVAGVVIVAATAIILIYFSVARYDGLKQGWDTFMKILQPFIIGAVMAFLMNPIMMFLERNISKRFLPKAKKGKEKSVKKTIRLITSILALLIFMGIIALFSLMVIPELANTIQYLIKNLDKQLYGVLEWANDITFGNYEKAIRDAEKNMDVNLWIETVWDYIANYFEVAETEAMVQTVATGVYGVGKLIVDVILGMILSVYLLIDKEKLKGQIKKIIYGWFKPKYANLIMDVTRKGNEIFYGFIIGKLIDSIIIGIICYVCMLIFAFPYPVLCSVIIGVTNIVPVFGPYIGAVPTVIIIFLTNPMKGIYFLLFVFILQQVDGNIIGPKILGDSTGLSSFWVVVAIVVGAGVGGVVGMLLGVPTMALIYYICSRLAEYFVAKKNLPTDTMSYVNLRDVDVQTNEAVYMSPEEREKREVHFLGKRKNK